MRIVRLFQMQISSIRILRAGWLLLLCLVTPLQSDPQRPQLQNYEVYEPAAHRYYPATRDQVFPAGNTKGWNVPADRVVYDYGGSKSPNPWTRQQDMRYIFESEHVPRRTPAEFHYTYANPTRDEKKQEELGEREREEEIMRKMNILEKFLSEDTGEKDLETNVIDDQIITETNIPEESKRAVRQVRKQRPGFFWTLARITFETINDTKSAIQQISNIINENVVPDPTTIRPALGPLPNANAAPSTVSSDQSNMSSNLENVNMTTAPTTMRPTTTTEENYVLTRSGFQSIIRRNVLGLIRLFNIEWQDAVNQSEVSVKEFRKDLGNQIGTFLQDNPNAY